MLFSIIMATYNAQEHLRRSLNALLNQTIDKNEFEVVIVDGMSTDTTLDIVKEYELLFEGRLRWISEKDSGIYDALNKGIKMARGSYINVQGADDILYRTALSHIALEIGQYGHESSFIAMEDFFREENKILFYKEPNTNLLWYNLEHQALFYRRDLHDKYGLYDVRFKIFADYDFTMKAFILGKEPLVPLYIKTGAFLLGATSGSYPKTLLHEAKLISSRYQSRYFAYEWVPKHPVKKQLIRLSRWICPFGLLLAKDRFNKKFLYGPISPKYFLKYEKARSFQIQ